MCCNEEAIMLRGATPTHIFDVEVDIRGIDVLYITYAQDGRIIVEKDIDDIEINENSLVTTLTQEETLSFSERGGNVRIQARGRFAKEAIISDVLVIPVSRILKGGVI